MNYDVYPNSNTNAMNPDVIDAVMPYVCDMLDVKRVLEERPPLAKQFTDSLEYRRTRACCPHRFIKVDEDTKVTILSKADIVTQDGSVKCKLCGAPILTNWDYNDFAAKLEGAIAVIDTILLYGPDFNLSNFPRGYTDPEGIIDKMIRVKEFLNVPMKKIAENFTNVGKAENKNSENNRTLRQNYRDHSSNISSWG